MFVRHYSDFGESFVLVMHSHTLSTNAEILYEKHKYCYSMMKTIK